MRIGVVRETTPGERRVSLVPDTVGRLAKGGNEVVVERGAGQASSFPDRMYTEAGATIGDAWSAELVLKVAKPSDDELGRLREGTVLIAFLQPLVNHALVRELARRRVTALSMDAIPRITRAQPMDALSSQATVAGYKAVLLAAAALPKFFPMLTTAAGPGRPAPKLIVAGVVRSMKPGSVIVDLAAETGGNTEVTKPGEVIDVDGVRIDGTTNTPSTMPYHASQMYSRNIASLLALIVTKEGKLNLDMNAEVILGTGKTWTVAGVHMTLTHGL